jgi:hypothetical protein
MNIGLFLVLMGLAAGSLALWFDLRFPKLAPTELLPLIVHMAAVTLLAKFVVPAAFRFTGENRIEAFTGVFGVAFPTVIYALLVGLWMLKLLQQTFASHAR